MRLNLVDVDEPSRCPAVLVDRLEDIGDCRLVLRRLEEALEGMPYIVAADVESARQASKRMQAGLRVEGAKVDLVPYIREQVERYHAWMQVTIREPCCAQVPPRAVLRDMDFGRTRSLGSRPAVSH